MERIAERIGTETRVEKCNNYCERSEMKQKRMEGYICTALLVIEIFYTNSVMITHKM